MTTLLTKHRIRRFTAEDVIRTLRAPYVTAAPGVVEAATAHIRYLSARLELIAKQIDGAPCALAAILERRFDSEASSSNSKESASGKPPGDAAILSSRPGAGLRVLAILLSGASGPILDRNYQALHCFCGVAPGHPAIRQDLARRPPTGKRRLSLEQGSRPARPPQSGQVPCLAKVRSHPRPHPALGRRPAAGRRLRPAARRHTFQFLSQDGCRLIAAVSGLKATVEG